MSLRDEEPELTFIIFVMVAFLFGITVGLFICHTTREHVVTQEEIKQHIKQADFCIGPECWVLQLEGTQ